MGPNQTPITPSTVGQIESVPDKKKLWSVSTISIFVLSLICLILLVIALFFTYKYLTLQETIPDTSDELSTQPLFDLTGIIEQINGSVLTVSQKKYPLNSPSEDLKYLVTVSNKTKIISELPLVPYSLKLATSSAFVVESEFKKLQIGQTVHIISRENIREIASNSLVADSITISSGLTSIMGKIVKVEDNFLSIQTSPPSYPEIKEFQIGILPETEIVNSDIMTDSSDNQKQKTKLPISVLTPDTNVLIYTDSDINQSENLNALKIEVIKNF